MHSLEWFSNLVTPNQHSHNAECRSFDEEKSTSDLLFLGWLLLFGLLYNLRSVTKKQGTNNQFNKSNAGFFVVYIEYTCWMLRTIIWAKIYVNISFWPILLYNWTFGWRILWNQEHTKGNKPCARTHIFYVYIHIYRYRIPLHITPFNMNWWLSKVFYLNVLAPKSRHLLFIPNVRKFVLFFFFWPFSHSFAPPSARNKEIEIYKIKE